MPSEKQVHSSQSDAEWAYAVSQAIESIEGVHQCQVTVMLERSHQASGSHLCLTTYAKVMDPKQSGGIHQQAQFARQTLFPTTRSKSLLAVVLRELTALDALMSAQYVQNQLPDGMGSE